MENIFIVSEEQRAILATVSRFVEDVVVPRAAALDADPDPEKSFSWEIVEHADAVGIRTMTLSEKWGGLGADSLTTAMVIEALAKGDLGVSVVMAQTLKIAQIMQKALNAEQQARVLPAFAKDPRGVLAIGITEPDNASNYFLPHPVPFRTGARRTTGGWVVNGMKHFISNGNRASHYLLFAQTEPGKPMAEASTCFLVERGRKGFTIGRVHDKMGERLANNAELIFDSCFVPDEDVLGTVDRGFDVISQFFPASNAYAAASVLGVAAAAYDRSIRWTRERVQGGRPLIEHDIIAAQLAEMQMLIDAARAYIEHAAWKADHRETGWDPTLGALPKVFASEVSWKVVTKALELHGAYGYMRDLGFEKLVRDAACFVHSDGVNRTLLLKAAQFIRSRA